MPRLKRSEIHRDERLIFFPTIGHREPETGAWHLPIHGWIFRPEADSHRRAAALGLLRKWLGLDPRGLEAELFEDRLRAFLVDNRARKIVTIRLDGRPFELVRSSSNGHILAALRLPPSAIEGELERHRDLSGAAPTAQRRLNFDVVMPSGDERTFEGSIHLVGEQGLSVISDIDDTIKITHVHDRTALLRQTFLRDFESVPGMADAYARWCAAGATFHYVSRSPWQLYESLAEFVSAHGFPSGTFHMRNFRWKNASTLQPDRHGAKKQAVIEGILTALPRRQFACVGDSGEHDAEIYGELARRYPEQVKAIFIRNVTGESRDSPRFAQAFANVPADRWQIFDQSEELPKAIS